MTATALRPVGGQPAGRDDHRDTDPVPPPASTCKPNGETTISIEALLRAAIRQEVREAMSEALAEIAPSEKPTLLTSDQLAAELNVSTVHIRKLVKEEGLPFVRFGDCRRYVLAEVIEWARCKQWDEVLP